MPRNFLHRVTTDLRCGLLVLLVLSGTAHAQSASCVTTGVSLQQMLDAVPACQKDAPFLAALGQQFNREGRYLEAADHLERALMLDPSLKDAQLSYAIALTGSGDTLSATALIDNLLADSTLPTALRTLIERQQATLGALMAVPEPSGWQRRLTLAARVGYDSNLMGSPNLESLALTLSGQTLVLPLDASYLARAGGYARTDAQAELHHSAGDGTRWDAVASLRSRYSPVLPEAGSSQIDLLLERSHNPQAPNAGASAVGSYFNLSGSSLEAKAGTHYSAVGPSGGATWRSADGCQARLGFEAQERNYLGNQVLSGRYRGVAGFWSCEQPSGVQWLFVLKAGRDAAQDAQRPGGDQRQASLRLTGFLPLNGLPGSLATDLAPALANLSRGGLLLDFEQSQQADASGYSPIIDSGATRSVARRAARLEYQHPVSASAQWVLGAEWVAQTSNLPLFGQSSWGTYSGLRLSW